MEEREIPGTTYGLSDKGQVDHELFSLITCSSMQLGLDLYVRVLLDGHSSHYQPDLIQYAKEHDIILFRLPPHTSHESQPRDVSTLKSLKSNWQDACHKYMQCNPGKVVTKHQFSELLNKAWSKTVTPLTICAGFRNSEVFPFNPEAIDCSVSVENPNATLAHS